MQNKSIRTILSEVKMFSSLEEDELQSLEKISHIKPPTKHINLCYNTT